MDAATNGTDSIGGRIAGIGRLLGTLDIRLAQTFDTLERLGKTAEALDDLTADGTDLVADLRERMDRTDAKLNSDLDELKAVMLAKLGELDVTNLDSRITSLETSIANIETAVTRMDAVVEGAVEAAPDFITKRVKEASEEVAEELPVA